MAELFGTSLFSDANLVSYYRLSDVSDSKGSNTLTNNNSVTFEQGKYSNGANCSGATKSLQSNATFGISGGAISIPFWVRAVNEISSGSWPLIWKTENTNKTRIGINYEYNGGTRRLAFFRDRVGIGQTTTYYTITLGTILFYHICLTYDGATIRGYVNGLEVTSTGASGSGSGGTLDRLFFNVDDSTSFGSFFFDDAAIFSDSLTATEVKILASDAGGASLLNLL